jgi:hypothetical protein
LRHPPPAPVLGASAACGGRIGWTAVAGDAAASGGVGHGRQAIAESTYGGGRGVSSGGMGAEVTRREVDLLGGNFRAGNGSWRASGRAREARGGRCFRASAFPAELRILYAGHGLGLLGP